MDATPLASPAGRSSAFATLRRFANPAPAPRAERCELCSIDLPPEHRHLLESAPRKIVCSCDPCALRFESVRGGRFQLIPRDVYALPGFQLDDSMWESLALPINLAFFFHDSNRDHVVAYYPSPAGATESLLTLEAWTALVEANPVLRQLQPDVQTLLVNRVGERRDFYLAPIDVCFELVGLIRLHWKGFTGGEEVWREIDAAFARLQERARTLPPPEAARA